MTIACQAVQAVGPYTYNAAGDEVTDASTGLVWKRCSAGQTWGGSTCLNTATAMTHEQALAHATVQQGWRLPNVKELSSIVYRSSTYPSIDITAFPNTMNMNYWTSSPSAGDAINAWGAYFAGGNVNPFPRSSNSYVRLVR